MEVSAPPVDDVITLEAARGGTKAVQFQLANVTPEQAAFEAAFDEHSDFTVWERVCGGFARTGYV